MAHNQASPGFPLGGFFCTLDVAAEQAQFSVNTA